MPKPVSRQGAIKRIVDDNLIYEVPLSGVREPEYEMPLSGVREPEYEVPMNEHIYDEISDDEEYEEIPERSQNQEKMHKCIEKCKAEYEEKPKLPVRNVNFQSTSVGGKSRKKTYRKKKSTQKKRKTYKKKGTYKKKKTHRRRR